ncbi:pseudouridylate synthase 7 homolog [Athalia rosae]|uniref:pseudouridylate synthase 7 homolog n=1 Tax=Athalia rosae TaxID=37344 RepID=UPI00203338B6|nr:pseudouridylate synthase 7 homolog [Athalia rosae]
MSGREDNKRVGSGNRDGNNSVSGGRSGYFRGDDRYANGSGNRSFSRGGYYGGGGDGWGRRGGGGHRGYRGGGFRGGNQNRRGGYKRNQRNEDNDGKRAKMEVGNRLKEVDTGVTEFVGDHKGFSGIVKERYADFHVNEITLDGKIAKLTNQTIPPEPVELENMEDLKKGIPSTVWEQLETLIETDSSVSSVEIDVTNMSKDERRAIHTLAKKIPNTISQTAERGETKVIVVAKANKRKLSGLEFRRDQRVDWSRRGGDYCHFLLHKVNLDTMDALNQLAISLRVKPNMFNYAGTKDRRARTTQWVSLKKINPVDIAAAGRSVRGAFVGNFKFSDEPLKLGMLSGNRFRIALRSVTGSDEEIEKAMTTLRDNGFINYYGLQRFGTVAVIPTHEIGKTLLQGKWDEAINLILKPRPGEQQKDLFEARKIYQTTKDAHAAYQRIGRPDKIEAKLLWGLHVCGEHNPQGALDSVPRNTSLMYIHAYQSLIWNMMVSKRIRELGRKPVVGDLVYENPNSTGDTERLEYGQDNEEDNANIKKDVIPNEAAGLKDDGELVDKKQVIITENKEIENDKEKQTKTAAEDAQMETEIANDVQILNAVAEVDIEPAVIDNENNINAVKIETIAKELTNNVKKDQNTAALDKEDLRSLPPVRILTEEDLPNYTIADVIMPQPGWRVTYPTYAKPWFEEILAKDGLTTDLRQKNRKYSLGGAYRKMLEIPSDMTWRVMHYNDRNDELILCDLDEMRGLPQPKDDPEGKYKAIIIEMSLKSSTYATMALREILKCDTSPQTQAAQSAANKAQEEEEKRTELEDEEKDIPEETKDIKDEVANFESNETEMNKIRVVEPINAEEVEDNVAAAKTKPAIDVVKPEQVTATTAEEQKNGTETEEMDTTEDGENNDTIKEKDPIISDLTVCTTKS